MDMFYARHQFATVQSRCINCGQARPTNWSVQAIDSGFVGSPFAAEQPFSISPLLILSARHAQGILEFSFRGTPGGNYIALATTNLS